MPGPPRSRPGPARSGDLQWQLAMDSRLITIKVHARETGNDISYRTRIRLLHEEADKPLTYAPYEEKKNADR